ncbi:MAG: DUF5986 family protein [Eubacteriales bacterium]|nr:DUF5986 family protein [Eubacteriales bacterium]
MEDRLKEIFVSSIQLGLSIAENKFKNYTGLINNHKRDEKTDEIMNAIVTSVGKLTGHKAFKYIRGRELLFWFDEIEQKLYSFHSERRLYQLLKEKKRGSKNYTFACSMFNCDENKYPKQQLSLFEKVVTDDLYYDELLKIKNDLFNLIGNNIDNIEHVAVTYNYIGYKLQTVKTNILNQYGELIEGREEDLSHMINTVDYSTVNPLSIQNEEFAEENITPKLKGKYISNEITKQKGAQEKEYGNNG